tara:strand:- start:1931 stop:2617 length:687 start_codon:yes stop_codon:yes gene_type:complete
MDNFDLKKFVSEKTLLNENAPGFYDRKSGEPLPTLESVQAAYEAKKAEDVKDEKEVAKKVEKVLKDEGGAAGFDPFEDLADELGISKLKMMKIIDAMSKVKKHKDGDYILTPLTEGIINEGKKSELDKKLAEIDKAGTITTLEAKIAAIDEAIEAKNSRINMVQEDENLSELIDKKRVKEMQKEIKLLERSKKLYEKQLDKANGKKKAKKEIVDEYGTDTMDEREYKY